MEKWCPYKYNQFPCEVGLIKSLLWCQTDEIIPVKFDDECLIWIVADQPLKDTSFLSTTILDHCGGLPIFWLQPTYHKGTFLHFIPMIRVRKSSQNMNYTCYAPDPFALPRRFVSSLRVSGVLHRLLHFGVRVNIVNSLSVYRLTYKNSCVTLKINDLEICKKSWYRCS